MTHRKRRKRKGSLGNLGQSVETRWKLEESWKLKTPNCYKDDNKTVSKRLNKADEFRLHARWNQGKEDFLRITQQLSLLPIFKQMKSLFAKTDNSLFRWINRHQLEWWTAHTHKTGFKTDKIGEICSCKWTLQKVPATNEAWKLNWVMSWARNPFYPLNMCPK